MTDAANPTELLAELAKAPNDNLLRENAARAQLSAGDLQGSLKTLSDRLINVTAHAKGSPLPSLHRKVMKAEQLRAEMDGEVFVRDFVCAAGRVLFFWVPESMVDVAEDVRNNVRRKLQSKLVASDRKAGRKVDAADEDADDE